jgi:hypothetical protein
MNNCGVEDPDYGDGLLCDGILHHTRDSPREYVWSGNVTVTNDLVEAGRSRVRVWLICSIFFSAMRQGYSRHLHDL